MHIIHRTEYLFHHVSDILLGDFLGFSDNLKQLTTTTILSGDVVEVFVVVDLVEFYDVGVVENAEDLELGEEIVGVF